MRKIIVLIFVVINISLINASEIIPKISFDLQTTTKIEHANGDKEKYETDSNYSIGLEYVENLNDTWNLGAGIAYQFDKKITEARGHSVSDATFNFMPIYITGEYLIAINNYNIIPFCKINLGYSIYQVGGDFYTYCDSKGGFYWSAGGGMILNENIKFELMYSVYRGYEKYYNGSIDDKLYSTISIGVGYVFSSYEYE